VVLLSGGKAHQTRVTAPFRRREEDIACSDSIDLGTKFLKISKLTTGVGCGIMGDQLRPFLSQKHRYATLEVTNVRVHSHSVVRR
jgi:hypothetical protein